MNDQLYNRGPQKLQLSISNVLVIVAITAVIAVLVYMLFDDKPRPAKSSITKPGEQARVIIAESKSQRGNSDLNKIFNQAEVFIETKQLEDAHLLLFFAARKGHALSARKLGEMYDPRYYSADTSIMDEPDFAQAYKWYRKAAEEGDLVAQEHLSELRNLVEEAARNGDQDATLLLMRW